MRKIKSLLPKGYTSCTSCCIRCAKVIDRSHPDCYELYCGADGKDKEPPRPSSSLLSKPKLYDKVARKWDEWGIRRQVQPWGTCPLFEVSKERIEYEERMRF